MGGICEYFFIILDSVDGDAVSKESEQVQEIEPGNVDMQDNSSFSIQQDSNNNSSNTIMMTFMMTIRARARARTRTRTRALLFSQLIW